MGDAAADPEDLRDLVCETRDGFALPRLRRRVREAVTTLGVVFIIVVAMVLMTASYVYDEFELVRIVTELMRSIVRNVTEFLKGDFGYAHAARLVTAIAAVSVAYLGVRQVIYLISYMYFEYVVDVDRPSRRNRACLAEFDENSDPHRTKRSMGAVCHPGTSRTKKEHDANVLRLLYRFATNASCAASADVYSHLNAAQLHVDVARRFRAAQVRRVDDATTVGAANALSALSLACGAILRDWAASAGEASKIVGEDARARTIAILSGTRAPLVAVAFMACAYAVETLGRTRAERRNWLDGASRLRDLLWAPNVDKTAIERELAGVRFPGDISKVPKPETPPPARGVSSRLLAVLVGVAVVGAIGYAVVRDGQLAPVASAMRSINRPDVRRFMGGAPAAAASVSTSDLQRVVDNAAGVLRDVPNSHVFAWCTLSGVLSATMIYLGGRDVKSALETF